MPRRGQELESYINSLLLKLEAIGIHGHKNNPLRTMQGITLQGEPFDYEVFMPDCIHLFDAKECSDRNCKWNISGFYDTGSRLYKQLNALYWAKYTHTSHLWRFIEAYFLVWFKHSKDNQFVMFNVLTVNHTVCEGKKYLTPEYGEAWTLGSEIEELLRKGRVK